MIDTLKELNITNEHGDKRKTEKVNMIKKKKDDLTNSRVLNHEINKDNYQYKKKHKTNDRNKLEKYNQFKNNELNLENNQNIMCEIGVRAFKKDRSIIKPFIIFMLVWIFSFVFIFLLMIKNDNVRRFLLVEDDIKNNRSLEHTKENPYRDVYDITKASFIQLNKQFTIVNQQSILPIKSKVASIKEERCVPEQNIVFLKTHKTGSSTITNILNRYADLRELLVVLPGMGDIRFLWPRKFHWSSVDLLRLDGQPANMLVNHARYDRQQMNMIMEDNSKYFTILRNPVSQFESSFYYFEFDSILRLNHTKSAVEEFLTYPDEYLYNLTMRLNDLPDTMNLIQSGMFYDLGYNFMDVENDETIQKVLEKLEKELSLVLIMEYFDESLVLLKNTFCWEFDDILYIKQNERLKKKKMLNLETSEKIKNWNRADVMLYQHFNKTFWKKLEKYGEQFWFDVKEFKRRNKEFKATCSPQKITTKGYKINVDVNSFVMNPKVDKFNRYLCEKLLMSEVDYLTYFRKKFQNNFGYQRILLAEGVKPLHQEKRLQKRLKKMHVKSPKFFMPGEIRKS